MEKPNRPIYLDCNATTPIDPRVRETLLYYLDIEFGNAGSRTHVYGQEARKGVQTAREQVASVVDATPDEVIFTSGATEANNLAILGLTQYGQKTGRKHILSTQIEHKAVLEPMEEMERRGFEVELVPPTCGGFVEAEEFAKRIRQDTLLVSVMHVNNETGVIQPLDEIAGVLKGFDAYFHVDAAQGFGKEPEHLTNRRIDMISASGHKIHAPKGIGCLIVRRRHGCLRALHPQSTGGGQERGKRAGTLPTALIASFGLASELASQEMIERHATWRELRQQFLHLFSDYPLGVNGDPHCCLPNVLNFYISGVDADLVLISLRDLLAMSTGSACTATSFTPSHVLTAMFGDCPRVLNSCRASWSHLTPSLHQICKKQIAAKLHTYLPPGNTCA